MAERRVANAEGARSRLAFGSMRPWWNLDGMGGGAADILARCVTWGCSFLCEILGHPFACRPLMDRNPLYRWASEREWQVDLRIYQHFEEQYARHRQPPAEPYEYTMTGSNGGVAHYRYTPERGRERVG